MVQASRRIGTAGLSTVRGDTAAVTGIAETPRVLSDADRHHACRRDGSSDTALQPRPVVRAGRQTLPAPLQATHSSTSQRRGNATAWQRGAGSSYPKWQCAPALSPPRGKTTASTTRPEVAKSVTSNEFNASRAGWTPRGREHQQSGYSRTAAPAIRGRGGDRGEEGALPGKHLNLQNSPLQAQEGVDRSQHPN